MAIKIDGAAIGVNNRIYAAGDLLGEKFAIVGLPNSVTIKETPVLMSATVIDVNAQNAEMDLIFFDQDPAATTFTNNAPLNIAGADLPKIIGVVKVTAADYTEFAGNSAACVNDIGLPLENEVMYACMVCRGTPTYLVNGISLILGLVGE